MAILIDSSVFIEVERRGLELERAFTLVARPEPFAIAALTVAELLLGVHLGAPEERSQRRAEEIESMLERLMVLPYDVVVARTHARIWADLRRKGNLIGPHDFMIAATALSRGYSVLTTNAREFRRVPDLDVREPAW